MQGPFHKLRARYLRVVGVPEDMELGNRLQVPGGTLNLLTGSWLKFGD